MPVDGVSGNTLSNYNTNVNSTSNANSTTDSDNASFADRLNQVPDADYSYSSGSSSSAPSKDLTSTDFLKLLAAQLQYQDMTNPMSNSEMMSTLTQMSSMNATTSMVNAISTMTSSMNDVLTVNLTSYATGMIGKEVTIALVDSDGKATGEKITGVVEGVSLYEGSPMVYVNGKGYPLSQVMIIGAASEEETETEANAASGSDSNAEAAGAGSVADVVDENGNIEEEGAVIDVTDKIDRGDTDTDTDAADKVDTEQTDAADGVDTDTADSDVTDKVDADKTDTDTTGTADDEDAQESAEAV